MSVDLDAYFARVGYDGAGATSAALPNLALLRTLHGLHPAALPFENLDPFLGRPVPLAIPALQAKMLGQRRGGYCFEHNELFRAVLEDLGFQVTPLMARIIKIAARGQPPGPRSHSLMRVDLQEGPFIADVGCGGQLVAAPLALIPYREQATPGAVLRFAEQGEGFVLETRTPGGWLPIYSFTLERAEPADYEVSNWYTSTCPDFVLTSNLLLERLTPDERVTLFNRRLTRRCTGGRTEVAEVTSADALDEVMTSVFGITSPEPAQTVFAKLPELRA